ncbi:MAG: thioesterase domain-containing protein [Lutisporaceae bacterium]
MKKLKLFCLPYACGSAAMYNSWGNLVDNNIEILPIELNGRGSKSDKPFYKGINEAAEDLLSSIICNVEDADYAFFGHSMGAIISYELVHRLLEKGLKQPSHMFFSGNYPPHIEKKENMQFLEDDASTIQELTKLGGFPEELLSNRVFMNFYLPIVRADAKLIETYQYKLRETKLICDISIFASAEDEKAPLSAMHDWHYHTDGTCVVYEMNGGHFYINNEVDYITGIINKVLLETMKK